MVPKWLWFVHFAVFINFLLRQSFIHLFFSHSMDLPCFWFIALHGVVFLVSPFTASSFSFCLFQISLALHYNSMEFPFSFPKEAQLWSLLYSHHYRGPAMSWVFERGSYLTFDIYLFMFLMRWCIYICAASHLQLQNYIVKILVMRILIYLEFGKLERKTKGKINKYKVSHMHYHTKPNFRYIC